ncbi:TPA: RNA degradosome polyphosphate kinase, partial [Candidatus Latescibacteria bacterium]|nr:RNA degradosome polyphosphate kinase [Candidatus Latescibacterota bacterium]
MGISVDEDMKIDLRNPSYYTNRELSWLAFNERVLNEARNPDNPLLERVKFLAIVANNLDEFFEIRVSGLLQQLEAGIAETGPDGMLPDEQLAAVNEATQRMVQEQYNCWNEELLPALKEADIHIRSAESLSNFELAFVKDYCHRELHPVVTPLTVNPAHPFPRVVN